MIPTPRKLQLAGPSDIKIVWDNGSETNFSPFFLRQNCPCASCSGHGKHSKNWEPKQDQSSFPILGQSPLKIMGAAQIGHYAIQFTFSDGHESGIYSYEFLHELAIFKTKSSE